MAGSAMNGAPSSNGAEHASSQSAFPAVLAPGVQLREFTIRREIGRGGMGVVYEADDALLGRHVALKRMNAELATDPKARERFRREARIVANLKHQNIIIIHSIVADLPGEMCLAFEYIDGMTLKEVIDKKRRLSIPDALRYLHPVASAIDYAHTQAVIHRDLKPSNIMISNEDAVKVMDFGIARADQRRDGLTTAQGLSGSAVLGTPFYMAPENWHREYVKESDIYAIGLCLYEVLTGKFPFEEGNMFRNKSEGFHTPITRLLPNLPKALDGVFSKVLDPVPGRRFHSAEEFIKAVEASLAPAPGPA